MCCYRFVGLLYNITLCRRTLESCRTSISLLFPRAYINRKCFPKNINVKCYYNHLNPLILITLNAYILTIEHFRSDVSKLRVQEPKVMRKHRRPTLQTVPEWLTAPTDRQLMLVHKTQCCFFNLKLHTKASERSSHYRKR